MLTLTTLTTVLLTFGVVDAAPSSRRSLELRNTNNIQRRAVSTKAGLAWPNGEWENIEQYRTTGAISWYYSWNPTGFDTDLEFVPMLWGENQVETWTQSINQTIADHNVTSVLAFNEPNLDAQANLEPQKGAEIWMEHIQPLSQQNIRLGLPVPTNAPSGKNWTRDFMEACEGCTYDFFPLHWYGVNASEFILYIEDMHETFDLPVWVTEWGCHDYSGRDLVCSEDDVFLFLNTTQTWLEETEWVERYAWFGAMKEIPDGHNEDNRIMNSSGNITDLGLQYIGAQPPATDASGNPVGPNGSGNPQGPEAPGGGGPSGDNGGGGNNSSKRVTAPLCALLAMMVTLPMVI